MEKNYVDLFRAATYMLMLVVRKDALFHSSKITSKMASKTHVNTPAKVTFVEHASLT
jgi:hypothetical protein